ncbi:ribosomal protein S5 domain 2-type protein [Achaetomium macrosporum]|uniref:Ribosomal RNA-processing protein 43 n=1 Tax=Achaetomium macrosporum TaxID=79813 RepID=A0AAN7C5N0_9PEZI|nr:ribosomal protein S5 domain 2-type protein [Achaetomium macrosporum]
MTTSGLSFTRPVFAKLSPHPYLLRNLSPSSPDARPARTNGRAPQEARPIHINASSLSHAHGSALVRTGDTTVICGVRGEILPVERIPQYRPLDTRKRNQDGGEGEMGAAVGRGELKDYDLLVPNIELATGSAPQFLPGVPPTPLAQTLSTRVYSLLHATGLVEAADLRIWYDPSKAKKEEGEDTNMEEGEEEEREEGDDERVVAYWVLYIDLLFVSFDGNPFDAAWAAVVAALRDTRLPVARWDPDREMVVCSRTERRKLNLRGLPVACSAVVFMEKEQGEVGTAAGEGRHWILLDPDRLEESLCREMITMVVDCSEGDTRIKNIEKQGGAVLGRELIRGYAGVAEGRWKQVREAMK